MKAVLGWLKSHVLIVVFVALILLLPPAGVVGSMMWNASIRTSAEELYNEESQNLSRAGRVSYEVPAITRGEQPVSESRPPNEVVSRAYFEERERRQNEVERAVRAAVLFNKGEERTVLVPGLFPDPPADAATTRGLTDEFVDRIVGTDQAASAYASLFASINAGRPPEPVEVARIVTQYEERELDRLVGTTDRSALTDEQESGLNERLIGQRIASYRQRADEISVYATPEVLVSSGPVPGFSRIPTERPPTRPSVEELFLMQMDYWAVEDLLTAVRAANSEAGGLLTEVPRSVVKRIDSIRVGEWAEVAALASTGATDPSAAMGGPGMGMATDPFADPRFTGGTSFAQPPPRSRGGASSRGSMGAMGGVGGQAAGATTHTGRQDAPSTVYDVRPLEVVAVVGSERMVELFDALAATNFMTVTGMSAQEVDVWDDLEAGYFYGDEHVLRVTLQIESVWLRQWTRDAMPAAVRDALGVVLPDPVEEEAGEDGTEQGEVSP